VLRGGRTPNHDAATIARVEGALRQAGLPVNIVVDCSHGNSEKQPERQAGVLRDLLTQLENGNRSLVGFMLESFLEPGSQPIPADRTQLRRGVSVTDGCLGWETTEQLLREAAARHRAVLAARKEPTIDKHG
jgi:3-deoxy-7-phosphoheptulonate synthase